MIGAGARAAEAKTSPYCVAITGAAGFIGGRLAELLRNEPWIWQVRGYARQPDSGNRTIPLRLTDEAAVRKALVGCQAVVNCAFDFQNMESNIAITRILAQACAAAKIRLVHISTAAIYEPLPDGDLSEGQWASSADPYRRSKAVIEEQLLQYADDIGLDLVILQPTIVYGPAGRAWTDSPVRELLTSGIALPQEGKGWCNAVYVDDVCRAAISALTAQIPSGERFLINGPRPVEWREFLGAYDRMIGGRSLTLLPPRRVAPDLPEEKSTAAFNSEDDRPNSGLKRAAGAVKSCLTSRLNAKNRSRLNMALRQLRAALLFGAVPAPTRAQLALYSSRCRIRTDKAHRLLNYSPQFDLERGMAATAPYVQETYAQQIARRGGKKRIKSHDNLNKYRNS